MLSLDASWRTKNTSKLFSKYSKDRIYKVKQYLNYILMIINQNILAVPWTFSNLRKIEIMKSINSQTNNKTSINDGLTLQFYKHFSNELAPVLLDVYDTWGKLDTMDVTSRKGIKSVICKKGHKSDIGNYRPIYYNS